MVGVQDRERAIYEEAWALPQYAAHSPGEAYLPIFRSFAAPGALVLDAGCGSGKGALALQEAGYKVAACDLTSAGLAAPWPCPFAQTALWADLAPVAYLAHLQDQAFAPDGFDWVYCTDVLEHIPPQFTMLAIDQMLRVAKEGLFLTVSTQPDQFGAFVGAVLHQTVQGFPWWRDSLRELGEIVESRDLIGNAVFVVRRRG